MASTDTSIGIIGGLGLPPSNVYSYPPIFPTVGVPADEVIAALTSGVVQIRRRVEIYQGDGITPMAISDWNGRLVDGSVTVDGTRDERRMMDITLVNDDGALNEDPYGGFWYDNILKVFWGIEYYHAETSAELASSNAPALLLSVDGGFESGVTGWVPGGGTFVSTNAFKHSGTLSGLMTTTGSPAQTTARAPFVAVTRGQLLNLSGWVYSTGTPGNVKLTVDWYDRYLNLASSVSTTAITLVANTWTFISANFAVPAGTVYAQVGPTISGSPVAGTLLYLDDFNFGYYNAVQSIAQQRPTLKRWEMQVGEFMIDSIDMDRFPNTVHVTGRDYAKKCLNSDITSSLEYGTTYSADQIIQGLAANAGVTKFRLPATGLFFDDATVFDVGTARWAVMETVATAIGYEIYFTADGYLTMRPFQDPVLSPLVYSIHKGPGGTMVSYKKTGDDSLLKNHVIVIGATVTDDSGLSTTAYGEAINTDPSSPTNTTRMGDRVYPFTSDLLTTTADCQALANSLLRVNGLEEFSIDFSTLVLPWIDANDIIEVIDPSGSTYIPTRFLLSSYTLPLGLGAMTGTAKRVTIVGTSAVTGATA